MTHSVKLDDLKAKVEADYQSEILRARKKRHEGMRAIDVVRRLLKEHERGARGEPLALPGRPPKPRDPDGKECTQCGERKPYDEFHQKSDSPDGRMAQCKECRKKPPPKPGGGEAVPRLCAKGEDCLGYEENGGPAVVAFGGGLLCGSCKERAGLG